MTRGAAVVVLGGSGLLGSAVVAELVRRGLPAVVPERAEVDLRSPADAIAAILARHPVAVVNAAAYTDVTRAELPGERSEVFLLNRDAPAALALACREAGIPLVHVSTDYVFDGAQSIPYRENDPPNPVQVYGVSKLAGERAVLEAHPSAIVVRVSTLYGPTRRPRPSYVDAILRQVISRPEVEVVETPIASPTFAPDVSLIVLDLLERRAEGIYHAVNDGGCSRLDLARAIAEEAGVAGRCRVLPRPEPPQTLRRPRYSVLDTGRLRRFLGRAPRPWRDALREYLRSTGGPS